MKRAVASRWRLVMLRLAGAAQDPLEEELQACGWRVVAAEADEPVLLEGSSGPTPTAVVAGPILGGSQAANVSVLNRLQAHGVPVVVFGNSFEALAQTAKIDARWGRILRPCSVEAAELVLISTLEQYDSVARLSRELEDTLTLHGAILRESPLSVYAKDTDLRFILSNKEHSSLIGRTPKEIIGRTDADLFGEDGAAIEHVSRSVLETGRHEESEFELDLPAGKRAFREVIFAIHNTRGEAIGLAGIAADITERRRQRFMLEKLSKTLRTVLETSPVALMLFDLDGELQLANGTARALLGIEEKASVNLALCFPGLEAASIIGHARERADEALDVTLRQAEGTTCSVELRVRVVELSDSEMLLLSLVDISARKMTEIKLKEAQAHAEVAAGAKSAFLAHMSHEIRTPMNAVLGFAQLLEGDPDLSAAQRSRVQTIIRAGGHLLSLVNQVLDMSVIEAGKFDIVTQPVAVQPLLDSAMELVREQAARRGITVSAELSSRVPESFLGDEGKLRQILVNLLGNAVRVVERGGVTVVVEVADEDAVEQLLFQVVDTGPGISPANLERIFAAFEQAGESTARGGAGLGLSISRKYAEMMRGALRVSSRLGEGTTFTLALPLERVAEPLSGRRPKPSLASPGVSCVAERPPRLVAVDDELDNLELLRQTLEDAGFAFQGFTDARSCLAYVDSSNTDLVLMDYRMPEMDGLEAVRALRSRSPPFGGPIVVLTASVFERIDMRAAEAGADLCLRKPFQTHELVLRLCELLGIGHQLRAAQGEEVEEFEAATVNDPDIPPELAERFRRAVEACDYARLVALAEEVTDSHPGLSRLASTAATTFDYADLLAALDRKASAKGAVLAGGVDP